jgi:hypothetical protein
MAFIGGLLNGVSSPERLKSRMRRAGDANALGRTLWM